MEDRIFVSFGVAEVITSRPRAVGGRRKVIICRILARRRLVMVVTQRRRYGRVGAGRSLANGRDMDTEYWSFRPCAAVPERTC